MRSFARLGRVLLYVVGVPLGLALVGLLVLLIVNLRDAQRLPAVTAALAARHDSLAPGENLFYPLLALDVRDSTSLQADGERLYARYLAARAQAPDAPGTLYADPDFVRRPIAGDLQEACGIGQSSVHCLARLKAAPAAARKLLAENAWLLARYESLERYAQLQNPLPAGVDTPMLSWSSFLGAKRLLLTSAAIEVIAGRVDTGLARVEADALYTRRLYAQPELFLIDKMVLDRSLRESLVFAGDLMRSHSLGAAELASITRIAAPLTAQERSLRGVLEREFEVTATVYEEVAEPQNARLPGVTGALSRPRTGLTDRLGQRLFHLNATLDEAWAQSQRKAALADRPCSARTQAPASSPGILSYAYNPVGKILLRLGADAGQSYIARLCDTLAMQRIVALQAGVHAERLSNPALDVADFIARSAPEFRDPYTDRPFRYLPGGHGAVTYEASDDRNRALLPWAL
jgi:hypothetical protein